jgi:hypothetical protein
VFAQIWYATIALPMFQFFVLRWLWRWAIWTYMLARLSAKPIATLATHPDRAAGIDFLDWPIDAFTVFALGMATVLAGAWGTELIDGHVTVQALVPSAIIYIALVIVLACGPLIPFTRHLYRARVSGLAAYTPFANTYVREFDNKWIGGQPASGSALGSNDIQALNDLGGAFQVVVKTRLFVCGLDQLRDLLLATLIPMLPLVLAFVPLTKLFKRLEVLFG